jgi:exodeoxyribonuclease VII large subunit
MQGSNTENSIIASFSSIYNEITDFDVVVILRGGGSRTDLSYFDNYNIASFTAQFPLPVFAGIGHERDESVTDMVANHSFKTPTAVADFIVENNLMFEQCIEDYYFNIINRVKNMLQSNELALSNASIRILKIKDLLKDKIEYNNRLHLKLINCVNNRFTQENKKLDKIINNLKHSLTIKLNNSDAKLNIFEKRIDAVNPQNVLKRGYTCTKLHGKFITDADDVKHDDILETITYSSIITSKVVKI